MGPARMCCCLKDCSRGASADSRSPHLCIGRTRMYFCSADSSSDMSLSQPSVMPSALYCAAAALPHVRRRSSTGRAAACSCAAAASGAAHAATCHQVCYMSHNLVIQGRAAASSAAHVAICPSLTKQSQWFARQRCCFLQPRRRGRTCHWLTLGYNWRTGWFLGRALPAATQPPPPAQGTPRLSELTTSRFHAGMQAPV